MRRLAIRLAIALAALLVASQFLLPPYLEHRVSQRLTEHGGSAKVHLAAIPALRLLAGHGDDLRIDAQRLSVDLGAGQQDVFKRLEDFQTADIVISDSRAGPFRIRRFTVRTTGTAHEYDVAIAGSGTAGDIASYAGSRLAGGFGEALAGLAASALGGFSRDIPFSARMTIDTSSGSPEASNVVGNVDGLPAGPLAQVVANALLSTL